MTLEELQQSLLAYIQSEFQNLKNEIQADPSQTANIVLDNFERFYMYEYSGKDWVNHETLREFIKALKSLPIDKR